MRARSLATRVQAADQARTTRAGGGSLADHARLMRPANAAVAAAGAYAGAILAGAAWLPTRAVSAAMVASFAFAAAGNIRNDITDVEIDRIAHPHRPLPRGAVSILAAQQVAIGLYLLALACGILVSWTGAALVLAAIPIMEGYERGAKARGLPGNVLIGILTAAPFLLGGMAGPIPSLSVMIVGALAALATIGREILKDLEDIDADRGARRTLPMRIGEARAAAVAASFLVGAVVLSPLPALLETVLGERYLVAIAAADLCFVAAAILGRREPARAQRLAKIGMVLALAALLVGRT